MTYSLRVFVFLFITVCVSSTCGHALGTKPPIDILSAGWQFYDNPTTLDAPGTIFRIDSNKKKFTVHIYNLPIITGDEVYAERTESVKTKSGIFAKFIGLKNIPDIGFGTGSNKSIAFSIKDVKREVTTDQAVNNILKDLWSKIEYKTDNRYYIIRETKSATQIKFIVNNDILADFGGEKSFTKYISGRVDLKYEKKGDLILNQELPKRMRVLYLVDEILIQPSLSGKPPEATLVPVNDVLVWTD